MGVTTVTSFCKVTPGPESTSAFTRYSYRLGGFPRNMNISGNLIFSLGKLAAVVVALTKSTGYAAELHNSTKTN